MSLHERVAWWLFQKRASFITYAPVVLRRLSTAILLAIVFSQNAMAQMTANPCSSGAHVQDSAFKLSSLSLSNALLSSSVPSALSGAPILPSKFKEFEFQPKLKDLDFGWGSELHDLHILGPFQTQRQIAPYPVRWITAWDTRIEVEAKPQALQTCVESVQRLQSLVPDPRSRTYLCALAEMDRNCLTSSQSQPHVPDPGIALRAVATLAVDGVAFCTGLFLSESRFQTSRHCFVDSVSGTVRAQLLAKPLSSLTFDSIDGKRRASVGLPTLQALELAGGFDIDKDAIVVDVVTVRSADALPLPQVRSASLLDEGQLLWLAGPVPNLKAAMTLQSAATGSLGISANSIEAQGIRWSNYLGAQCRTLARRGPCSYHSCQTFPGFSGSPLILAAYLDQTAGVAVIEQAGVHSGTPGNSRTTGWPQCLTSTKTFNASDYQMYNVGHPIR